MVAPLKIRVDDPPPSEISPTNSSLPIPWILSKELGLHISLPQNRISPNLAPVHPHRNTGPPPFYAFRRRSLSGMFECLLQTGSPNNAKFLQIRKGLLTRFSSANAFFRILWAVDADVFASLVLLNRQWNSVSDKLELYAHHLSRCPSYALTNNVITGPYRRNDLKRLKAKFAIEVRRNLFDAYLRPRETLVSLICTSANSSAAFPGGEAFRFTFSPNGQTLLALSSSRIFVLDLTSDPIAVKKELKTFRRPLSAAITDDGSLLAVLSTKHQANIYELTASGVNHVQILVLDNPPRNIALAHEGTVLAAAYEGGVEVFSLAANALSTDRRAVRCEAVDSLTFSGDGSMLVGSSHSPDDPNAVIITAPFYTENDPNLSNRELHSRMWTTQILFPNNSSTCSHAALLPSHGEGDGNWLFAFDHTLRSYRAVRTDDTRTGIAYFLSPQVSRRFSMPSPSIAPTASATGDLVVAGFFGTGLWLYGIPERVDTAPDMGSVIERHEQRNQGRLALTSATGNMEPLMAYSPSVSGTTDSIEDDSLAGKVDWRQSIFVKCRHLSCIDGLTAAQWVEKPESLAAGFPGKRLAVVAPGGVSGFGEDMGEEPMPVDGGRILLMDFDYSPQGGGTREMAIEVGQREPELLPEQRGNLEVEVALERRRTVRQTRGRGKSRLNLARSATAIGSPPFGVGWNSHIDDGFRRNSMSQPSSPIDRMDLGHGTASPPNQSQSRSRSRERLQRAATAAGISRARYPPRPPLNSSSGVASGHVVYRRQDGRREIPHESDADNWEPPPPPYSRSSQEQYEDYLRATQLPRHATEPIRRTSEPHVFLPRASTTLDGMMLSESPPSRRMVGQYGGLSWFARPRGLSESSLDTLAEVNHHQHIPDRNGAPIRADSGESGVSEMSTEMTPYSVPRRPVSFHSRALSDPPLSLRATITSPMSPNILERSAEEIQAHQFSSPLPPPNLVQPDAPRREEINNNVSLTGSNLQNRLNHPVPPPPSHINQQIASPYIPSTLHIGQPAPPTLLPPNRNSEPFTLRPPTADQVANLHRRMSQEIHRRPVSVSASTVFGSGPAPRDFGVPPSPPRAAWGAAGIPGSVSFNKARNSTQGLSRNNSRGSQRSFPLSMSAPNLHLQRPRYGRLDTIESIASFGGAGENARSRVQSVVQGMGFVNEPMHDDGRIVTDPKLYKKKKKRRAEKEPSDTSQDGRKKKGSRCVIM